LRRWQDDFGLHIHARFAPRVLAAVAAAREAERALWCKQGKGGPPS
jgi:hypothetical protein